MTDTVAKLNEALADAAVAPIVVTTVDLSDKLISLIDMPALILVFMLCLMVYVLVRIQRNPNNNFDFADIFRDEHGRASGGKMCVLGAFAVSSWYIMYAAIHSETSTVESLVYLGYMVVWLFPKTSETLIQAFARYRLGSTTVQSATVTESSVTASTTTETKTNP